METIVIFGAGQFGRAAASLINTAAFSLAAFGDNNPALWNCKIPCAVSADPQGIPVLPPAGAVALNPGAILIGVTDSVREEQLRQQARSLGYTGKLIGLSELSQCFDIRSAVLFRLAGRLKKTAVPGAVAELGVYRGDLAWKLNALFPDRPLYLFDTFEGFDSRDMKEERAGSYSRAKERDFSDTSAEAVLARLPYPEQAVIREGYFPGTADGLLDEQYALVSLDADLFAPILAGLEYFYPRLSPGGMILLHDYGSERFKGAGQAVETYEAAHGRLSLLPLCDLHGSAVIVRPYCGQQL